MKKVTIKIPNYFFQGDIIDYYLTYGHLTDYRPELVEIISLISDNI